MEESESFAVGHFAFGYVLGKASSNVAKTEINVPLVLTLSVIPDADIMLPFLQHRGPTHSIQIAFMVFIPIFAIYRKKAIPYFLALIQHPLIGDYIAGGRIQLLWPLTSQYYGIEMSITSHKNITLKWIIFLASTIIMLKAKNTVTLFQPHNSNLILIVPMLTVLLPTFLSFPLVVPTWLIPPHLVYMTIFLTSIIVDLSKILRDI